MSLRNEDSRPGTTLDAIIKEREDIEEYLRWLKRRCIIEDEFLASLRSFRASANPQWPESTISGLTSPMLEFIDSEIKEREKSNAAISAHFKSISEAVLPDEPDETGTRPTAVYKRLNENYADYLDCGKKISSPESVGRLEAWYNRKDPLEALSTSATSNLRAMYSSDRRVFRRVSWGSLSQRQMTVDIQYRQSVVDQQAAALVAGAWHKISLPMRLEEHQQCVEDVKDLIDSIFTEYSQLSSTIVQLCARGLNSQSQFSSSRFIALHHETQDYESDHISFTPAEYRNYARGGVVSKPIFGMKTNLEDLLAELENTLRSKLHHQPPNAIHISLSEIFLLEEHCWPSLNYGIKLDTCYAQSIRTYFAHALLSLLPFIPLQDDDIKRHSAKSVPRSHLVTLMREIPSWKNRIVGRLVNNTKVSLIDVQAISTLLCHRKDGMDLMINLFRKWDFKNSSPLPEGTERINVWSSIPPLIIWSKTRLLYFPYDA